MTKPETETLDKGAPNEEEKEEVTTLDDEETETEDDPTEETETDEETEESEDGDETEEDEAETEEEPEPKRDKVQARIDKLVAKLNAAQDELKETRLLLEERETYIREEQDAITKELPAINYNGRSIYELTDDQFLDAIDECYQKDIPIEQRREIVKSAKDARAKFKKLMAPVAQDAAQAESKALAHWEDEWKVVQTSLLEAYPDLERHIPQIQAAMAPDFKRATLVERLKRDGVLGKYKYTISKIKDLGIDLEIQKVEARAARPEPSNAGKGKASSKRITKPSFTRDQISRMSMDEFLRREKDIDAAMRAGRIK